MTTDTLFVLALIAGLALVGFLFLFGFDWMLASYVRSRVAPGEQIVFESSASRNTLSFPAILFGRAAREGHLIVTDRKFLFSTWNFAPIWRSTIELPLEEIGLVQSMPDVLFPVSQVSLSIKGKTVVVSPRPRRFWPFSRELGRRLIEAIDRGKLSRT